MSDIDIKFWQLGGPSFFGPPITGELGTPDGRGSVHHWSNASIWSSAATGAHEVHGAIYDRYRAMGAEAFLGFPVTDEQPTSDNNGRVSSFEYGSIYWCGAFGAHEVYGAIGQLWQSMGAINGIGYPMTGELAHPDRIGRYQRFQRGTLYWSPATGAYQVAPGAQDSFEPMLSAFAANPASSPWHGLPRGQVASRLRELVDNPDLLAQRGLNTCGPAGFLRTWAKRDPMAFLAFATELYDSGQGRIGSYKVAPDDDACLGTDYQGLLSQWPAHKIPATADWMLMAALRDAENAVLDYEGRPDEDVSGITTGGEIVEWMAGAGVFGGPRDEMNLFFTKGLDHAVGLDPARQTVMVCLNSALMGHDPAWYEAPFPNHWVGLDAPLITGNGLVKFTYWTYGRPFSSTVVIPTDLFVGNYYGAVIAS